MKRKHATRAKFLRVLCSRWQIALVGGNANNSSQSGAFTLNTNNDSANDNANIGAQLRLYLKKIRHSRVSLALAKKSRKPHTMLVGLFGLERFRGGIST